MKRTACIMTVLGVLTGCGTSPEPGYFALAPVSGAVSKDVTYTVKIQRPFLPGYLDRPDIVQQDSAYQVQVDETHRWAEPLDRMFERVLAEDLRQRLPAATIVAEDDGPSSEPRAVIVLDVQQFNKTDDGQASLQAQLNLQDKGVHEQPQPLHIQYMVPTGSSASAMAESLSALVGKLADEIAPLLRDQAQKGGKAVPSPGEFHIED